jgi:hypothetical protein
METALRIQSETRFNAEEVIGLEENFRLILVRPMRFFPSMLAAIVTGAIGTPLLIWGWNFIETTWHSQLLALVWAIVALIIPVILATTDLRDVARRWRDAGLFGSVSAPGSREAFRQIYLPAWKRMAAWFVSALVSLLLLTIIGVNR